MLEVSSPGLPLSKGTGIRGEVRTHWPGPSLTSCLSRQNNSSHAFLPKTQKLRFLQRASTPAGTTVPISSDEMLSLLPPILVTEPPGQQPPGPEAPGFTAERTEARRRPRTCLAPGSRVRAHGIQGLICGFQQPPTSWGGKELSKTILTILESSCHSSRASCTQKTASPCLPKERAFPRHE